MRSSLGNRFKARGINAKALLTNSERAFAEFSVGGILATFAQ